MMVSGLNLSKMFTTSDKTEVELFELLLKLE